MNKPLFYIKAINGSIIRPVHEVLSDPQGKRYKIYNKELDKYIFVNASLYEKVESCKTEASA